MERRRRRPLERAKASEEAERSGTAEHPTGAEILQVELVETSKISVPEAPKKEVL